MTLPPQTGNDQTDNESGSSRAGASTQNGFATLDVQLGQTPAIANGIVRKHWELAEREQYPFWIGIFLMAVLGALAFILRDLKWFPHVVGLAVPSIMTIGLIIIIIFYIRGLHGRFERQWSVISADGQLFKFLRDAGLVLGHPVELGEPNEHFSSHLDISFPEVVRATETWIRNSSLPDPVPDDSSPGLFVPPATLKQPSNSETHRVYEMEYRGVTTRATSIRIDSMETGCRVTVGFTIRPSNAENRDRLADAIVGRLQDRLIAAKVLGDIREAVGLEPEPIPDVESQQSMGGPAASEVT